MPRFNPLRASLFPFILAALLIATGLTGCAKQRASMALDKARKDLTQAKEIHEAEKYCPDKLKEADEKFKAASNDMSSNQFDSALINGKIAAELSRQLLTTTKQLRAGALVAEADKHVKVIEANHAESIDKVKYDKIHQLKEDAVQANGKDKHDKAIELGLAVKTETDALLNQLKTDMESKLADVKKVKLEELLREEGRKEAQAFVTKAESDIVEMEKMISYEQREYVKAGNLHTAIVKGIADGIIEARKNRSVKKLAILEEKLVRARFEGAEQYHAQRLAECESTYTNINKHFQSADYVFVLTNADIFDPQLDRLILETRTLCAKDKMQNVVNAIAAMEADQVRKYLPDRLEKVEKMLASAQGEFKNDLFDEVKKICAAAMEEKELIIKDFDALAVEEIRKGRTDMDSSSDLLGKMGNIFAIHSPISQDPQRTNFENGKRALQGELDRIVKDSALLIGVAEVQREGKKMSAAIEASRKVVRDARYVTYQIYHVIVHNNLLEISDRMTRIAGDGGSQFAQAELDKATKVLQEAQEMVREREKETATLKRDDVKDPDAFKLAIAKTSDAFTEMEVVVQRVKHVVADKIDEARKSVGAAEKCKTELFAQDDMANVKQMVQQSEALLAKGELYNSACKADEVKTSALNAAVKSAGLYADRELDGARIAVKKATDAGTEQYAPVRLKDAQQRLKTSEDLYNGVKTSVDKVKASES
ncbi:TPA: hypothetical protein DDW35_04850, partial [Candidatus Sumerlaeota bacterium]|nr:hypothetical protein [Candidatus Sumerlaeota bacterium]